MVAAHAPSSRASDVSTGGAERQRCGAFRGEMCTGPRRSPILWTVLPPAFASRASHSKAPKGSMCSDGPPSRLPALSAHVSNTRGLPVPKRPPRHGRKQSFDSASSLSCASDWRQERRWPMGKMRASCDSGFCDSRKINTWEKWGATCEARLRHKARPLIPEDEAIFAFCVAVFGALQRLLDLHLRIPARTRILPKLKPTLLGEDCCDPATVAPKAAVSRHLREGCAQRAQSIERVDETRSARIEHYPRPMTRRTHRATVPRRGEPAAGELGKGLVGRFWRARLA